MDVHSPANAPDHVHGCPVHVGGSDAGKNKDGERVSDACFWDEHTVAFKTTHKAKHDAAKGL